MWGWHQQCVDFFFSLSVYLCIFAFASVLYGAVSPSNVKRSRLMTDDVWSIRLSIFLLSATRCDVMRMSTGRVAPLHVSTPSLTRTHTLCHRQSVATHAMCGRAVWWRPRCSSAARRLRERVARTRASVRCLDFPTRRTRFARCVRSGA